MSRPDSVLAALQAEYAAAVGALSRAIARKKGFRLRRATDIHAVTRAVKHIEEIRKGIRAKVGLP